MVKNRENPIPYSIVLAKVSGKGEYHYSLRRWSQIIQKRRGQVLLKICDKLFESQLRKRQDDLITVHGRLHFKRINALSCFITGAGQNYLGWAKKSGRPKPSQAPPRPTDFGPVLTHEGLDKNSRKSPGQT